MYNNRNINIKNVRKLLFKLKRMGKENFRELDLRYIFVIYYYYYLYMVYYSFVIHRV